MAPPDRAAIVRRLERYVEALLRGDRADAAAQLSERFGVHEGRDAAAHVEHELAEFARRAAACGLGRGFSVSPIGTAEDRVHFLLLDADGRLVYEDTLGLDGDAIAGDGSLFETVSKLHISRSGIRRGLSIRKTPHTARLVLLHNARVTDSRLGDGGFDPDCLTFRFAIEADDGRGFWGRFTFHAQGLARGERKTVFLRGLDHPLFVPDLHPRIEGRRVHVEGRGTHLWALNVATADGRTHCIEAPADGTHLFDAPVATAILTDGLDNDWQSSADER